MPDTALITGASSGIGAELARCFAVEGYRIVLVARRREALEKLAAELRQGQGVDVIVEPADLADPGAPQTLFDNLHARGIAVDVVVNNAGFGLLGEFGQLPLDKQLETIQVNVTALTALTRIFLPGMIERRRGGILNVGSTAGFQPGPRMAIYYATKAFVLSFTEALAEELTGHRLRISCLCPGPTKTGFGEVSGMDQSRLFRLGTMTARDVALAGYRGWRAGRTIVIPGLLNRLSVFAVRFLPRFVVSKIVMSVQQPRN